jgi:hypothetical protein
MSMNERCVLPSSNHNMANFEVYLLENGLENIQNLSDDQFISGFQEIAPGTLWPSFPWKVELDQHKNITYASLLMNRMKNNHFLQS